MTINDKDQVLIPMVTTIEAALDFGYSLKDIRQWRIGNRMCTVILVPGTKEQYDSYLSSFSKEFKAEGLTQEEILTAAMPQEREG